MKRIVVFCTGFLGGIIGFIGWVIACASQSTGKSEVIFSLNGTDFVFAIIFLLVAILGGTFALLECFKTDKKDI